MGTGVTKDFQTVYIGFHLGLAFETTSTWRCILLGPHIWFSEHRTLQDGSLGCKGVYLHLENESISLLHSCYFMFLWRNETLAEAGTLTSKLHHRLRLDHFHVR